MTSADKKQLINVTNIADYRNKSLNLSENAQERRIPFYSHDSNLKQKMGNHGEVKEHANMDILEKYIDKMDRDQSDLRADIKASEERTERRIERLEKLMTDQSQRIETKIDSIETKFDSWNKWIIGTCLATIIGIATMVITVLVAG